MLIRSWLRVFSHRLASANAQNRPRQKKILLSATETLEIRSLLSASVLTYHNDNQSSGVNPNETLLTRSTLDTFQKLTTTPVDGQVYAQPLYVSGLSLSGGSSPGIHNTTLVATQHDSLYAIDSQSGSILWQISLTDKTNPKVNLLGAQTITSVPNGDTGSGDIQPEIGVTSTPVIDAATNTMYVEAKSKAIVNGQTHYVHTLYRVDISAGTIAGSAVIADTISNDLSNYTYRTVDTGTGTDPYVVGTGDGAITVNGQSRVYFNALRQMNRSGVVLENGHLVIASASHGDNGPYHGWVLMYDPTTLGIQAAFNTTPNGGLGGVWQGGGKPVVDAQGNLYFETGNGTFDSDPKYGSIPVTPNGFQGKGDYGDAFLKIAIDPTSTQSNQNGNMNGWGLKLVDYFSPFNNQPLDDGDVDLGSGGPTLLPDSAGSAAHPHLLIGSGKEGKIYLIDRDNMGKFDPNADHVVQVVPGGISGSLNEPGFFDGRLYYVPGYGGSAHSFSVANGYIDPSYQQTPDGFGYVPGSPSISANGTANGLMWVIDTGSNELRAYDASNLANEVWTSAQAANNRDQLGNAIKFTVSTVADGHVIAGTSDSIVIYGRPGGTPSLANIESTPVNYIEKGTSQITNTITVSETGSSFLDAGTVQITGNFQPEDRLLFTNTPKITGSWDQSAGILTLRGVATPAEYQSALRSVNYFNFQNNPSSLVRTVTFLVGSNTSSNPQSRNIVFTLINDPPVITVDPGTLDYIRGSTTQISPGLTVTDPDSDTLPSAIVKITGNYKINEDFLIFPDTSKITGTWDVNTGTLYLNGIDTVSNYRTALRSVAFYDKLLIPNTSLRTVSFSTTDGSLPSNVATRDINVIRLNNPPVLSSIETTTLTYTQNVPAILITQSLAVTDPEDFTLPSATVKISAGYQNGADVLSFVNTAKITGAWDPNTGTLTLTGVDSLSNYRSALRTVRFFSSNFVVGNGARTISFQVTDGTDVSNIVTRNVAVAGVPNLSGIETTTLAYTVQNAAQIVTSTLQVAVFDAGRLTSAKVSILNVQSGDVLASSTIAGVTSTWNASAGTLTLTGASSAANYQSLLRSVTYRNPSQNPNSLRRQISFQVFEGTFASNIVSRNINFTSTNNQPELSNIETTPLAYRANDPPKVMTSSIIAFDPDNPTLVSAVIQITGNYRYSQDLLQFNDTPTIRGTWTPATGKLVLQGTDTVSNYQAALRSVTYFNLAMNPSTVVRTVSFRISDGAVANAWNSNTVTRDITVSP